MWRPKNWDAIVEEISEALFEEHNFNHILEAGADAILKALKNKPGPIILDAQSTDVLIPAGQPIILNSTATVRGQTGSVVFIPDGHDPDTIEGMREIAKEALLNTTPTGKRGTDRQYPKPRERREKAR